MATLQSLPTIAPAALERIESAKRAAALRAVEDYFSPNFEYVGIGSGSTILYVIEAIKAKSTNPHIRFVPTGYQSREEVRKAGLKIENYDDLPEDAMLDIAFDGADEVDDDFNCVKGGGACLYQEKLVATKAKKFVCVAGKPIFYHSGFFSTSGYRGLLFADLRQTTAKTSINCSPAGPIFL